MKRFRPVEVITYFPTSSTGKEQLAQRTAAIHADIVHRHLSNLNCSAQQKQQLAAQIILSSMPSP